MQIVTLEVIRIFKFLGVPGGSVEKNLPANAGDTGNVGLIPGLGRSPGGGNGNPLQYSSLNNTMNRRAWQAIVHGVTKSQTQLSNLTLALAFLPGESHGQRSLAGYSPWSHKESDTTK